MLSRRTFIQSIFASLAVLPGNSVWAAAAPPIFKGSAKFQRILGRAIRGNWINLPIGELVRHVAAEMLGTPYVARTLELSVDREFCSVNLDAVDCMTLVEICLAFARMLKKGGRTPADLMAEIQFIRYRGGKIEDYSSRLHYMSDWLYDNQQKGVLRVLSDIQGSQPFLQHVSYMSDHPDEYALLVAHPDLVPKIKRFEDAINARSLTFVPLTKIIQAASSLATGDIVGVCTNQLGLDIVHSGIIDRDTHGVVRMLDASSLKQNQRVVLEHTHLEKYLTWSKHLTGVMFARPLEPPA
jgi:hypothetical protein